MGESVNMVSGIGWPGGDPFLQRQNEPSIAVSSANPQHLLAGANDYRSVDIPSVPGTTKMPADAWQGVFKSYDGGQTWKSYLMPGYPFDPFSPDRTTTGLSGPFTGTSAMRSACAPHTCNAAADPVVRAGTDGMFFFAGITFARDTNYGAVVVNRFIDLNDKENGEPVAGTDPIQWVDAKVIDQSNGAYFADKPWIAVDVPRTMMTTAGPIVPVECTIKSSRTDPNSGRPLFERRFMGGAVYAVWARIYQTDPETADVMFSRSLDCGETWSDPIRMNDPNSRASQGAVISVDPLTGYVYAAWRRYAFTSPRQENAIMSARSFSKGQKFSHPHPITSINAFDQAQGSLRFRTEALPTIATSVDPTGTVSWAHVAWAERQASGESRIVATQARVRPAPASLNEADDTGDNWKIPAVPIDTGSVQDDLGNTFSRGHQFMPQLTFSQGRLVAVYYDSRLDHTRGYHKPNLNCTDPRDSSTCTWGPNATTGRWYVEERGPIGERGLNLDWWTHEIDDTDLAIRHTIDVRVAMATPSADPQFTSTTLSRMPFGERGDEATPGPADPTRDLGDIPYLRPLGFGASGHIDLVDPRTDPAVFRPPLLDPASPPAPPRLLRLQDLQSNPPNLSMFKNGSRAFIGDYIDVQGPMFVQDASGAWAFNTRYTPAPVFHAVWTSNQDVVPPHDPVTGALLPWSNYTPVTLLDRAIASSLADGVTPVPVCVAGQAGSRNQNVYTARITDGLLVTSPQNAKWLDGNRRGFVVSAFNATSKERYFEFSFAPPPGIRGSIGTGMVVTGDGTTVVRVGPIRIPAHSSATQTIFMSLGSGTNPATTVVNVNEVFPDGGATSPPLTGWVTLNPPSMTWALAQPDGTIDPITGQEQPFFEISAASLANASLQNASLANASLQNASLQNASLQNASLANYSVVNASLANASLQNASLANASLVNSSLENASLQNASLANASLQNASLANASLANASLVNASLQNASLANASLQNASLANASLANASLVNAALSDTEITDLNYTVTNTGNTSQGFDVRLLGIGETDRVQLIISKNYTKPTAWGCTLWEQGDNRVVANAGAVSAGGVITEDGFEVRNQDSLASFPLAPGETMQITLRGGLTVDRARLLSTNLVPVITPQGTEFDWYAVALIITSKADQSGVVGQQLSLQFETKGAKGAGMAWKWIEPIWTNGVPSIPALADQRAPSIPGLEDQGAPPTDPPSLDLPLGAISGTPTAAGTYRFFLQATDTYTTPGSSKPRTYDALKFVTLTVTKGQPTVTVTATPASPSYGGPVILTARLSPASGPTGCVQFSEGSRPLGEPVCLAPQGTSGTVEHAVARPSAGEHTYTATYVGDANWLAAAGTRTITVQKAPTSVALATDWSVAGTTGSPVYGETVTLRAQVSPDAGPTGEVEFWDGPAYLGKVLLDALGTAEWSVVTPPLAAIHAYQARYLGDANWAGSTGEWAVEVGKATPAVTLAASPASPVYGGPVTLTARISSTVAPTGCVEFKEGASLLQTVCLSPSATPGTVTWTVARPTAGTHVYTARYLEDDSWFGNSSQTTVVVQQARSSVSLTSSIASPSYGQAFTLTATLSPVAAPRGSIEFKEGTSIIGSATPDPSGTATWTIADTVATAAGAGMHTYTAEYAGDANWTGSSAEATVEIRKATTTVSVASAGSTTFGATAALTASVTVDSPGSGTPTGTVQFVDTPAGGAPTSMGAPVRLVGGSATLQLSTLTGGSHSISATYSGDANFAPQPESGSATQVVHRFPSAGMTITTFRSLFTYGESIPVRLEIPLAAPGALPASGQVDFEERTLSPAILLATRTLSGASADLTLPRPDAGSYTLGATYRGDTNYSPGSATAPIVVVTQAPVAVDAYLVDAAGAPIDTSSSNPFAITSGDLISLAAHVTGPVPPGHVVPLAVPDGDLVTFLDNDTIGLGQAALRSGSARLPPRTLPVGNHRIGGRHEPSPNFALGESTVGVYVAVSQAGTTAAIGSSPNPSRVGASVILTCTVSLTSGAGTPSGEVEFWDGATSLGKVGGTAPTWSKTVSFAGGTHLLSCGYLGDGSFSPSVRSPQIEHAVEPVGTTASITSVSPSPVSYGQSFTLTAKVTPAESTGLALSGTVSFRSGATDLGSAPVSSDGKATLTVPTLDRFKVGTYSFAARFNGDGNHAASGWSTTATLTVKSAWTFTGFLSPLKTAGDPGSLGYSSYSGPQKLGSGIPLKWQLKDASGKSIGDLTTLVIMYALANPSPTCTDAPPAAGYQIPLYESPSGATGGSTFRFGSNNYVFTWDTTKYVPGVGCYTVVLVLRDGTTRATNILLQ